MADDLTVNEIAIPSTPRVLAALSASEMASTQAQLKGWCLAKLKELAADYREQRDNFTVAKAAKWKTSSWENAMRKTKRKLVYYGKIFAAVKAGYVIVPDFAAEVMAVRVDSRLPRHKGSDAAWRINRAQPGLVPVGMGRYVDDMTDYRDHSYEVPDSNRPGHTRTKEWYTAGEFNDVIDFPIAVVKPIVMDATQRAMSLRIFDTIEVAGAPQKDPIVLGRIRRDKGKQITFFIAWWLDVETL